MNEATDRQSLIDQLQFLGQMASTETALFHQKAAAQYGLGITEMKTVSILMQEGSMTAGQIAGRLCLTTGAVTNLLDRLEKLEVVRRRADPQDRRKVIVEVNLKPFEEAGNVYDSMWEAFAHLLETYSTPELEFLVQYYHASIEVTKSEIAKLAER